MCPTAIFPVLILACSSIFWVLWWNLGIWDKLLMDTEANSIAIKKRVLVGLLNCAFTYSTTGCTDLILPMLFLNKTLFPHMNIWCMSKAYQHIETYWFLLNVTSAAGAQGIHYFSLFLPIRVTILFCACPSYSGLLSRTQKRKGYVLESVGCSFSSTSHFWGNSDTILLSYHSFRFIWFNSGVASSVCYRMPDDHFGCSQLFKRVCANEGYWNWWSSVYLSFL